MKKFAIIVLGVWSLLACEREKETLLPGRFVDVLVGEADMLTTPTADYQQQVYYDLSSNAVKSSNLRNVWDLALASEPEPNLVVNSGMLMAVAATGNLDFEENFQPDDYSFEFERARNFYRKGRLKQDFNAQQEPAGQVYLLDMGRDFDNQERGYYKLQILDYQAGEYTLKLAALSGGETYTLRLSPDDRYNYQFIHFGDPEQLLSLEPPRAEWDMVFGRYLERLFDGSDTLDYSVTGVLLNPYQTEAYQLDSATAGFSALDLSAVQMEEFTVRSTAIGHDWKSFSLDNNSFSVNARQYYLVKDEAGQIFKLRFTGFYSPEGRKGAVTFEYLPLN